MSAPEDDAIAKSYDAQLLRRLLRYLRPYWAEVAFAFVLIVVMAGLDLVAPWLTKLAIDEHIAKGDGAGLWQVFGLYLANVIGESGLTFKPRVQKIGGEADELANRRLREEWAAWGQRGTCTLDGQLSWREVEDLLAVSWQRDGEAFLRLVRGRNVSLRHQV